MLNITPHHKVFLATRIFDFRKRLDGTVALCRAQFQRDPSSGHIFVFRNRKLTVLRCIVYDKGGYWFMEKRLSKGKFIKWPKTQYDACTLSLTQLKELLENEIHTVNLLE